MGVDIFGKSPTTEAGKYFQNSWWSWRPLADYVCEIAPEIAEKCKHRDSNDGYGLNKDDSERLSAVLKGEINNGRTKQYELRYASQLQMMPDELCYLCEGTGMRRPAPECGAGDIAEGGVKCNRCNGSGHVRPPDTSYPFDIENVQEFATFLRGCGGFEIC